MPDKVHLFGIAFDRVRMTEAVGQILDWCRQPPGEPCRIVVTPNVDHAVLFQEREALRAAYASAAMVLVDGAPIVWASRFLRRPLPERVAGSDLVPAIFEAHRGLAQFAKSRGLAQFAESSEQIVPVPFAVAAESSEQIVPVPFSVALESSEQIVPVPFSSTFSPTDAAPSLRIFLLGAAPGVAERAAAHIAAKWPAVSVVGTYSPPLGFENDAAENHQILDRIADAAPDVLVVGLGAPKQELWVHAHHAQFRAKVALCAGATIDFLAGQKRRSPRWMRHIGLEWLHRVLSEPRRLAARYARDARIFPRLVWREWQSLRRI